MPHFVEYPGYGDWSVEEWSGKGYGAYWWTSSLESNDSKVYWGVLNDSEFMYSSHDEFQTEQSGLSVRCGED